GRQSPIRKTGNYENVINRGVMSYDDTGRRNPVDLSFGAGQWLSNAPLAATMMPRLDPGHFESTFPIV
ncbi:MAG TPA: hypothetical protein VGM05_04200, partial [Planctomycetaceae bacterium]